MMMTRLAHRLILALVFALALAAPMRADAAVVSAYSPPVYTGNGSTTQFAFSQQFFLPSDLVVQLYDTSANALVSPQPVLNGGAAYDYTVSGAVDPSTGEYLSGATVTFNTAPLANHRVTIFRAVPALQPSSFSPSGPLPAKTIEANSDRAILILQQDLWQLAHNAIGTPAADALTLSTVLPGALARANQSLVFDSQGQPTTAPIPYDPTLGYTPLPFVPDMATLLSATTTVLPIGTQVMRLAFSAGAPGPAQIYEKFIGPCATYGYTADNGFCGNSTDGNSWVAQIRTAEIDPRLWGLIVTATGTGLPTSLNPTLAAANEAAIVAAKNYAETAKAHVKFPAGYIETTQIPMIAGDWIEGIGGGQNQQGGSDITAAAATTLIYEGSGTHGFVENTATPQNQVHLRNLAIVSADGWNSTSPTLGTCIYQENSGGGYDWDIENVTCQGWPVGLDGYNLSTAHIDHFLYNAQTNYPTADNSITVGYPNRVNGMPYAGMLLSGGNTQGLKVTGSAIFANQIARDALFNGDGSTTTFPVDLSAVVNPDTYLFAPTDLQVSVGGVVKTLGTDYHLTDATSGAPITTVYGEHVTITGAQGASSVTLSDVSHLPSSIASPAGSASWKWPVDPVIVALPISASSGASPLYIPGTYATGMSGTTMTTSNPLLSNCTGGCPAIVEETFVASHDIGSSPTGPASGCNGNFSPGTWPNFAPQSKCGQKINVVFNSAPAAGTNNIRVNYWGLDMQAAVAIAAVGGSANTFDFVTGLSGALVGVDEQGYGGNTFRLGAQLMGVPFVDNHSAAEGEFHTDVWDTTANEGEAGTYLPSIEGQAVFGANTALVTDHDGLQYVNLPSSPSGLKSGQVYALASGQLALAPGTGVPYTAPASYTPTIVCGSGTPASYTVQSATYQVIGGFVNYTGEVKINGVGTCSGTVSVQMPTTAASANRQPISAYDVTAATVLSGFIGSGGATMLLKTAAGSTPTNTDDFTFSVTYY